jgi:hypothetical protein
VIVLGRRVGRPSKLTKETTDRLTRALALGAGIEEACIWAKIGRTSFYRWLEIGERMDSENRDGQHRDFYLTVKRTLAESEIYSLSVIARAQESGRPDSWRSAAWLLERRYPTKWGSRRFQTTNSDVNTNVTIDNASEREERINRISEILENIPDTPVLDGGGQSPGLMVNHRRRKSP